MSLDIPLAYIVSRIRDTVRRLNEVADQARRDTPRGARSLLKDTGIYKADLEYDLVSVPIVAGGGVIVNTRNVLLGKPVSTETTVKKFLQYIRFRPNLLVLSRELPTLTEEHYDDLVRGFRYELNEYREKLIDIWYKARNKYRRKSFKKSAISIVNHLNNESLARYLVYRSAEGDQFLKNRFTELPADDEVLVDITGILHRALRSKKSVRHSIIKADDARWVLSRVDKLNEKLQLWRGIQARQEASFNQSTEISHVIRGLSLSYARYLTSNLSDEICVSVNTCVFHHGYSPFLVGRGFVTSLFPSDVWSVKSPSGRRVPTVFDGGDSAHDEGFAPLSSISWRALMVVSSSLTGKKEAQAFADTAGVPLVIISKEEFNSYCHHSASLMELVEDAHDLYVKYSKHSDLIERFDQEPIWRPRKKRSR